MKSENVEELVKRADLLEGAGYKYNFERELYLNRKTKKVFSMDFLEDRTVHELEQALAEETGGEEWKFYFIQGDPPPSLRRELERMLTTTSGITGWK